MNCKCPARSKEACQNNNDGKTCPLVKRIEELEVKEKMVEDIIRIMEEE